MNHIVATCLVWQMMSIVATCKLDVPVICCCNECGSNDTVQCFHNDEVWRTSPKIRHTRMLDWINSWMVLSKCRVAHFSNYNPMTVCCRYKMNGSIVEKDFYDLLVGLSWLPGGSQQTLYHSSRSIYIYTHTYITYFHSSPCCDLLLLLLLRPLLLPVAYQA